MDVKLLASAGLVLGLTAGFIPLAAADPGWYVGLSGGQSRADTDAGELDSTFRSLGFTSSSTVDKTDTGWKLFAGYQFNPYFAVEGGYVDLGKFSFSTTVTAAPAGYTTGSLSGNVKTKNGFLVDAVGIWPATDKVSVFGKLGLYSIKTELSASGPSGSLTESSTDSNLHWGIGAGYDFNKNFGARLEWERFNDVGNKDKTGEANVDLLSVGVVYKF